MSTQQRIAGLWLPLVTPFKDGRLDETSLARLVRHYTAEPVDGLILAATTGEGQNQLTERTNEHHPRTGEDAGQGRERSWASSPLDRKGAPSRLMAGWIGKDQP